MTAEERIAKAMSLEPKTLHVWSVIVRHNDLRDLLSLIASLRAANAEQRAVIERLTRPEPEQNHCPHCGFVVCLPSCEYKAISARQKAEAVRNVRLCSKTACAGDVADFVRDVDEMGGAK